MERKLQNHSISINENKKVLLENLCFFDEIVLMILYFTFLDRLKGDIFDLETDTVPKAFDVDETSLEHVKCIEVRGKVSAIVKKNVIELNYFFEFVKMTKSL